MNRTRVFVSPWIAYLGLAWGLMAVAGAATATSGETSDAVYGGWVIILGSLVGAGATMSARIVICDEYGLRVFLRRRIGWRRVRSVRIEEVSSAVGSAYSAVLRLDPLDGKGEPPTHILYGLACRNPDALILRNLTSCIENHIKDPR